MGLGRVRVVEVPYAPVLGSLRRRLGIGAHEGLRTHLRNRTDLSGRRSFLDRLAGLAAEVVNYPDAHRRWRAPTVSAIEGLLKEEQIGAVLSTSSPVTAHLIAHDLKVRHDLPWVADLRDLWSQNHNYGSSGLRRRFDFRLERNTLHLADALVTVSEPWAERLRYVHHDKPVYRIPNGFDPDILSSAAELPTKFTVRYTGNIYPPKQNPRPFFLALRRLCDEGVIDPQDLEITFLTPKAAWLEREINRTGVADLVRREGTVPHQVALQHQRNSHALLLLNWDDPKETGTYPLKVFEYLAAKRPIIAVGGGMDVVSDLLAETRAGKSCVDEQATYEYLRELYREFKETGTVSCQSTQSKIDQYGYDRMARRFTDVLDDVIGGLRGN